MLVVGPSPECDLALFMADQTSVGDRAPSQVPRQVLQDLLGLRLLCRGWLDVDDPGAVARRRQPGREGGRFLQARPLAFQLQLALPVQTRQTGQELVPETLAQHAVVDQVGPLAAMVPAMPAPDPLSAVHRWTTAGNQRMQVRIVLQPLVPGVEHQQGRRVAAQFLTQHCAHRLPGRVQQEPIRRPSIPQHQGPELLGEREHDLEVVDLGEQQRGGLRQPVRAATATALRAVAVEARVVDGEAMLALRAGVDMPAQSRRPAEREFGQHALHLRNRLPAVTVQIVPRVLPQQIDYAEGWAGSLPGRFGRTGFGSGSRSSLAGGLDDGAGVGSTHRGHCRTGSQSSGLGTDSKCGRRTCR